MEGGVHISSQGDAALRVRFTADDAEERWHGVRRLVSRLDELRLPAISGVAATYDSALVEFDCLGISPEDLRSLLHYVSTRAAAVNSLPSMPSSGVPAGEEPRYFRVPVRYGGDRGPDLALVAELFGESEDDLIARHSADWYLVRCFGAPAASPMMDGLGREVSVPRRSDPRVRVPGGSVALAGVQSLIYSVNAPGGWQLIGHTPVELVSAHSDEVCAYRPGDYVGYFPITDAEWDRYEGSPMEEFRVERD